MRSLCFTLLAATGLAGCGASSGIVRVGLDTYALSEMRSPVLGGGVEAQRVVLAEASAFCAQQGRVFQPLQLNPGGDPRTPYYPTAFDAVFRCAGGRAPAGSVDR